MMAFIYQFWRKEKGQKDEESMEINKYLKRKKEKESHKKAEAIDNRDTELKRNIKSLS